MVTGYMCCGACAKAGLLDHQTTQISKNASQKKNANCMLNAFPVSENSCYCLLYNISVLLARLVLVAG